MVTAVAEEDPRLMSLQVHPGSSYRCFRFYEKKKNFYNTRQSSFLMLTIVNKRKRCGHHGTSNTDMTNQSILSKLYLQLSEVQLQGNAIRSSVALAWNSNQATRCRGRRAVAGAGGRRAARVAVAVLVPLDRRPEDQPAGLLQQLEGLGAQERLSLIEGIRLMIV